MQVDSISSITKIKKFCDKFFCDQNPFISFDFFSKLEKSDCTNQDTGWVPEHLIFRKRDKLIGFIPNFKNLIQMENIFLIIFLLTLIITTV